MHTHHDTLLVDETLLLISLLVWIHLQRYYLCFEIKEFRTGRESGRGASVKWRRCWGIENISNSDPNLLLFDHEFERTLRRARQVRRRIEFVNNLRSQTENLASVNNSSYSSDSDFDSDTLSSSDTNPRSRQVYRIVSSNIPR
ncbi:hypothetical protein PIB30_094730 [Stylosanthes scabra]|uniref:Uncharacterized protein n=1 Tax=Stylosanthes scabra TaxID=79078 RepID=A0ABU6XV57_9FABA|nr:hypothetical protein [Stylosanthes scabra]